MRTRNNRLIAGLTLALAGCSSGGTVIVRQPPRPVAVPVVIEPLEVDVTRPHNGKIYVQTNRAAYVAIFDIVPERGVTMVYPVSGRQQRFVVAGLRDVSVWWEPSRVTYHGAGMSSSRSRPARYVYVLASDEPLRIPEAAFRDGYLYQTLGNRDYRAANPYATMRALARQFVPSVIDEAWAEDVYGLSATYTTERYQVTRVYCRNGSVYEIPSDLADHVWCPAYPRGAWDGPGRVSEAEPTGSRRPLVRPDSVLGDNGRRIAVRPPGSNGRGPIERVKEPPGWENRGNGRDENGDGPGNNGNGQARGHQEDVANGRGRSPNDRQDDGPPGQRRIEAKEVTRVPPRPAPLPVAANTPTKVEPRDNPTTSDKPGKPETPAKQEPPRKPDTPVKADAPANPDEPGKPDMPGRSDSHGKSDKSDKPDAPGKPDAAGKPDTASDTGPDSKAESKSQGQPEKRGGPGKGRGRPNDGDDKSADRKPKPSADAKP